MAPTVKEEIARLQKEESSKKAGATEMDEEKSSGDTELAGWRNVWKDWNI